MLRALALCLPLAAALSVPAWAGTAELKNDSFAAGGQIAVQLGFIEGEVGGAVLQAAPGDYPLTLDELQVFIDKSPLIADTSMIGRFIVWDNANFPNLGTPIYTSADLQMGAGFMNTQDVSLLNLQITNGAFVVGVEIVDSGTLGGLLTSPSMVTDTNGCQSGLNWVRQTNGVWADLCSFGVSGDLVIRAVVETNDGGCGQILDLGNSLAGSFAPSMSASGCLDGLGDLTIDLAGMPPSSSAFLFIGLSALNAPFKQGVLVPTPDITTVLPTVFGTLQFALPYPLLPSGFTLYWQAWMPDSGAPAGASATQALGTVSP